MADSGGRFDNDCLSTGRQELARGRPPLDIEQRLVRLVANLRFHRS